MVIQSGDLDYQETNWGGFASDIGKRGYQIVKGGFEISVQGALALAGAVFYAGWIASAGYFQVAKHWDQSAKLVHIETVDVPKLKSIAGCQIVRGNIATKEAAKSVDGEDVDLGAIPNCPGLPKPLHAGVPPVVRY